MSFKIIICVLCTTCIILCNGETSFSQDSYTSALQNSHQTDFGDPNATGYDYSPPPNNNYLPPSTPNNNYLPPQTPNNNYLPPASNNYLPPDPKPVYGPPIPVYGPPPPTYYSPIPTHSYQPRDNWLLEKLKTKINFFAIGKIILKLLIFKKFVKFVGIICLLLFLPKLKGMFKDDMMASDEDGMESKHGESLQDILEQRIDVLYEKFMKSLEKFEAKQN